jgi:PhnB protein
MNSTLEAAPKTHQAGSPAETGQIQPYLNFDGRCAEAIEFYRRTLGAEVVVLSHFRDAPKAPDGTNCPIPAGSENKVMHSTLRIKGSTIHASDCHCGGKPAFAGVSLSLVVADEQEAESTFAALSAGGQVVQPLTETFFSSRFGVAADPFGVVWMVLVTPKVS